MYASTCIHYKGKFYIVIVPYNTFWNKNICIFFYSDPLGKVELSMELKNNLPVGDAEGWRLFKRDHVAVLMIHDFGLDLDSYEAQLLKDGK